MIITNITIYLGRCVRACVCVCMRVYAWARVWLVAIID